MKHKIRHLLEEELSPTAFSEITSGTGLESIPAINEILREGHLSLEPLERLEKLLKSILKNAMSSPMSGRDARNLALAMKEQGLLLKYKPYAIKAASPFGYSIFLQREGEGFSYQNHLTHKTEVFHILEVLPGGFVFLCNYADWEEHYERDTFEEWLRGARHPFFDACKFVPEPGDVFVISELGIVHTVIGCVLEEYATASTDMVQRLYDQNDRYSIPPFPLQETQSRLQGLRLPTSSRRVDMLEGEKISWEPISPTARTYGHSFDFVDSFVKASHVDVKPNLSVPTDIDAQRVTVIRVFDGQCDVMMRDEQEHRSNEAVDPISARAGDVILVPPVTYFEIQNKTNASLSYSEHRIDPSVALL